MNRDNVLFLVIGALVGFIGGYVMHEVMATRQPAPRLPGAAATNIPAGNRPATPAAGPPAAGGGPQAAMQQVQQLRAHVEQNPDDVEALRKLANLNYDISNWSRAAELYQRYLGLEPDNLDVMTDLGAVYRFLGQPNEALEQFRNVRRLAPEHWQARYNEVLVLAFDLEDLAAANQAMEDLLEIQGNNPDVARLAAELKKRSEAG